MVLTGNGYAISTPDGQMPRCFPLFFFSDFNIVLVLIVIGMNHNIGVKSRRKSIKAREEKKKPNVYKYKIYSEMRVCFNICFIQ